MTVKEEYREMKMALRKMNEYDNWSGTKFSYALEHFTNNAITRMSNMIQRDWENLNVDNKLGVISDDEYKKEQKILSDCLRSMKGK